MATESDLELALDTIRDLTEHDHWAWAWGYGTTDIYYAASLIFIAGLNYLSRADILRFREVAADVTAGRWGADYCTWHTEPGRSPRMPRARLILRALGAAWQTHPRWEPRRRYLNDPSGLLLPDALTMFLTGAAAAFTADQLTSVLDSVLSQFITGDDLLQALLASGFIAVIGGGGLWRAVQDAVSGGRLVPSGLNAGIWLGLGMATIGFLSADHGSAPFPAYPEVLVALPALAGLAFAWAAQVATLAAAAPRLPRLAMATGLTSLWLLLAFVMYQWNGLWSKWLTGVPYSVPGVLQVSGISGSYLVHPGFLLTTQTVLLSLSDSTFIGLWWVLSLFWLVPMALTCVLGTVERPRWLARAILLGLLGGVLACCGVLVVALAMNGATRGRYSAAHLVMYLTWWEIVLSVAALMTAVATALVARAYRLLSAMIATAASVLIGLAALYGLSAVNGCAGPLNVMTSSCHVHLTVSWMIVRVTGGVALHVGVAVAGIAALCVLAIHGLLMSSTRAPTERLGSVRRATALVAVTSLITTATIGVFGVITASAGVGYAGGLSTLSQGAVTVAGGNSPLPRLLRRSPTFNLKRGR